MINLQGPVAKHDSVEGQGSGDGVLLDKLYEGETRRLSLVSGHPHKLYVSHLLEELQQLLCGGGLWVQVADVDGPPDLIDFWGIYISHEGGLGVGWRRGVETSW